MSTLKKFLELSDLWPFILLYSESQRIWALTVLEFGVEEW